METVTVKMTDIAPRCLTSSAGMKLLSILHDHLSNNRRVILDFSDITMFASLFFNNSITKLMPDYPVDIIRKKILVKNLNETGQKALSRSLEVGSDFYHLDLPSRQQLSLLIEKKLSDWE
ncbi:STAS-like domain-containing protein [Acetobacter senegalensis]